MGGQWCYWIKCEDEMPDPGEMVIGRYAGGGVDIMFLDAQRIFWDDGDFRSSIPLSEISHWMYIPEEPQ